MKNGFFTIEEFAKKTTAFDEQPLCSKCKLDRFVNTPKMEVNGKGKRKILIIGEAPGFQEDAQGIQFVGKAGTRLSMDLMKVGISMREDCWTLNAVNCYTDKTPTRSQIKCCHPYVRSTINKLKPEFILLVGGKAVESFLMDRFRRLGITRWRGYCIPDKTTGAWVYPILHPSYILRKNNDNYDAVFLRDLKTFSYCLKKKPYRHHDLESQYTILTDFRDVVDVLENILHHPPKHLFFDYETTGLKPHRPGHKILCVSLDSGKHAHSFPFQHRDYWTKIELEKISHLWKKVLKHPDIKLWGQNIKFEDMWSRVILQTKPVNWHWDTMIASHIIDNRSAITNLNFQIYKEFGIEPYDAVVKPFIEGHPFNRLEECPIKDLLTYSAKDSLAGRMLAEKQKPKMGKLRPPYDFFHEGIEALSDVQMNGIRVDLDYFQENSNRLKKQKDKLEKNLQNGQEARKFQKKFHKPILLTSTKDLGNLFNNVLGISTEISEKDNYIVDKKTLEQINTPFTKKLLRFKKLDKIIGTYLAQFLREGHNDIVYPFFDLHIPRSYRGSSSRPNFQNIPVRDEESKKICRSGIYPSWGNQILEVDYSGIEVGISACYHKDPKMIDYIKTDPGRMHYDAAKDIWGIDNPTDDIRFFAKNCWVFPQFYGSYFKECAKDLWANCIDLPVEPIHPNNPDLENVGRKLLKAASTKILTLRDNLWKQNIRGFTDFVEHLKQVEDKFWKRFKVYAQWKKEVNAFYRKYGYIESYLGFKYRGVMSENDVSNYSIQGGAFHCLLWLLIQINKLAKAEKWKTKIIGQIHDSIVFDLYPPERSHVISMVDTIGTRKIKEVFPWIIVPLRIDKEITPIDGSWYEKEKIK